MLRRKMYEIEGGKRVESHWTMNVHVKLEASLFNDETSRCYCRSNDSRLAVHACQLNLARLLLGTRKKMTWTPPKAKAAWRNDKFDPRGSGESRPSSGMVWSTTGKSIS